LLAVDRLKSGYWNGNTFTKKGDPVGPP